MKSFFTDLSGEEEIENEYLEEEKEKDYIEKNKCI